MDVENVICFLQIKKNTYSFPDSAEFHTLYHLLARGPGFSDVYLWYFYKYIYKDTKLVELTAKNYTLKLIGGFVVVEKSIYPWRKPNTF